MGRKAKQMYTLLRKANENRLEHLIVPLLAGMALFGMKCYTHLINKNSWRSLSTDLKALESDCSTQDDFLNCPWHHQVIIYWKYKHNKKKNLKLNVWLQWVTFRHTQVSNGVENI